MRPLTIQSAGEQVAAHLKNEILRGNLAGNMPGVRTLASQLGINHKTAEAALAILENGGLLKPQGTGRPRQIAIPDDASVPGLKIKFLLYEPHDVMLHYIIELQHLLEQAGHPNSHADKTMTELNMDPMRVARLVRKTPADAWIVAGGSREILDWFANQKLPVFALFGDRRTLPIAFTGPTKADAIRNTVAKLAQNNHRRISMLVRGRDIQTSPGTDLQHYFHSLEKLGIAPSRYNLPHWENSPESLEKCLSALFQHTPPTALLIDDTMIYHVTQHYLAQRGIIAPRDISLVCMDPHPSFHWCKPTIAHIDYNPGIWVRNIVNWVNDVAVGKVGRDKMLVKATFVDGGSIGPAPK